MRLFHVSIILLVFSICVSWSVAKSTPKSGPYITKLLKTEKCKKPTRPYNTDPSATYSAEIYNTTKKQYLLRGNISVYHENKNVVVRVRCFSLQDGEWKLVYLYNNAGCRSRFVTTVISAFGIEFDHKKCSVPKGVYSFQNIDQNKMEHIWASTREYGRMLWKVETWTSGKTDICWETETEVVPDKAIQN